jgi:transcriptional regulator with XRE-family HTH domain
MPTPKESPNDILVANVRALMKRRGWGQEKLGAEAGISQTHVGNILRKEVQPTTQMIAGLAKAFNLKEAYLLFVPNLPVELLDSNELPALIQTWLAARTTR